MIHSRVERLEQQSRAIFFGDPRSFGPAPRVQDRNAPRATRPGSNPDAMINRLSECPYRFHALAHGLQKLGALCLVYDAASRVDAKLVSSSPVSSSARRMAAMGLSRHRWNSTPYSPLCGLVNALGHVAGLVGEQPLDAC